MYIKPSKIFPLFLTYGVAIFFFISVFWVISGNLENIYSEKPQVDELIYQSISNNFTIENIKNIYDNHENKPFSFLLLEKILNSDIFLTRLVNFIFVIINTILIYKITKNRISFLYPIIPIFLNSMWMTVETIETMFLLFGLCYKERQGIFFALATIFRPYSFLYSIFLKGNQFLYFTLVGFIFVTILHMLGLFVSYLYSLVFYTGTSYGNIDFLAFIMLFMLFIMGARNKTMLGYALIASLPLILRGFTHYFIVVYTFLFIGFLLSINEDLEDLKRK